MSSQAQPRQLSSEDQASVIAFPKHPVVAGCAKPLPDLSNQEKTRLYALRDFLAKSRLSGEADLHGAYARIMNSGASTLEHYGALLFHVLTDAAKRRIVFHCRICPKASADEKWMLRLIDAHKANDDDNVRALLSFIIKKEWRTRIAALTYKIAHKMA